MAIVVIGYYVHHQGRGHLQRMMSIAAELPVPLTVLSSLDRPSDLADDGPVGRQWIRLPADDSGSDFVEPTANGTWHWVPRQHAGLRSRMAIIAEWVGRTGPTLMVVDVSVEVAALATLLGVPTVVMAMRGDRSDRPHVMAYDGAYALLAPWAAEFAPDAWPPTWTSKTFHAGPIGRLPTGADGPRRVIDRRRVLVLWGSGGTVDPAAGFTPAQVDAARSAHPEWSWRLAGGTGEHRVAPGEVGALLEWADVVITHGGQNAVAEVAASRTPAVVVADARPHGEQHDTVSILDRAGVAVGVLAWPSPAEWPRLLDRALGLGGDGWSRWLTAGGAARAARFLSDTADALRRDARPAVAR